MSDPTPEELAFVKAVFDSLVDAWVRWGRQEPRTVSRAQGILDRALTCSLSLRRKKIGLDGEDSDGENIGSSEVAEMLGVTRRTVQRNAEALGGKRVSGSWVFDPKDIGDTHAAAC